MSTQDVEKIVELAMKPKEKIENRKMWIRIFGYTGIMLSIGFVGGDWFAWRREISGDVDKLKNWKESTTSQTYHEQRVEKNKKAGTNFQYQ